MEHSRNIPVFTILGTLFGNIPPNFIGNFFQLLWEWECSINVLRRNICLVRYSSSRNVWPRGNINSKKLWYLNKILIKYSLRKSVRIRTYSGLHFPFIFWHSDWIQRDMEYRSVFSANLGKMRIKFFKNNVRGRK